MDGERIAFTEEGQPGQYLKLVAAGEVDDTLLEALEDYVKRQRKRLAILKTPAGRAVKPDWAEKQFAPGDFVPADGVYEVHHHGHLGPGRADYSKGQRFMPCDLCADRSTVRYTFATPPV